MTEFPFSVLRAGGFSLRVIEAAHIRVIATVMYATGQNNLQKAG
jgi:hypothetical protein